MSAFHPRVKSALRAWRAINAFASLDVRNARDAQYARKFVQAARLALDETARSTQGGAR